MKVIKALRLLLSLILVSLLLCSCMGKEKLSVKEISSELEKICLNDETAYDISKADIENRFNFDGNLLNDSVIKMSNDEEKFILVAVMQVKEKESKQIVIDGINGVVKAASASFSVLGDSQIAQIQGRLFYEYDDVLIVVVAEKYDAVKKYLEEIGATKVK